MRSADGGGLLLDTHVWFWLGAPALGRATLAAIERAVPAGLWVQAISVWEMAILESKGRIEMAVPLEAWVAGALALPGLQLVGLEPAIAMASTRLPGELRADPADCILAATARQYALTLVTRDAALLAYGRSGHLRVLAA